MTSTWEAFTHEARDSVFDCTAPIYHHHPLAYPPQCPRLLSGTWCFFLFVWWGFHHLPIKVYSTWLFTSWLLKHRISLWDCRRAYPQVTSPYHITMYVFMYECILYLVCKPFQIAQKQPSNQPKSIIYILDPLKSRMFSDVFHGKTI
jgi:hypothetical protein